MDDLTRLALAARDGDRVALTAFVRKAQPEVWRLCARLVSPAAADDVTQDTFLRVLRALPAFRAESSARTWVLAIARRTAADAVRGETRRRRLASMIRPRPPEELSTTLGVDLILAKLDPDRRAAFVLTQLLGLSYSEAAEVCDCPVGTIRSRVARAREQLIAAVADEAAQ